MKKVMGNFYVNITTKDAQTKDLEHIISDNGYSAFIISENNYCVIYEKNCDRQDTTHLTKLLKQISNDLSCTAFGILNHDDDMLLYSLWHQGEELDHYNSCPGMFAEEPTEADMQPKGGNASLLTQTFLGADLEDIDKTEADKIASIHHIKDVLHSGDYVFAVERHSALVSALGLPECSVGYGYNYLSRGEVPENMDSNCMIEINGN